MNRTRIIIPARYESTRFPGKPLADIGGKPMIQRVWEWTWSTCDLKDVWVSTDDHRIQKVVQDFGGNVVLTSPSIENGTARCAWSAHVIGTDADDVVINVQGDQPLVDPAHINQLRDYMLANPSVDVATIIVPVSPMLGGDPKGTVYAVTDHWWDALYFSRSPMPFPHSDTQVGVDLHRHVGLYAYRVRALTEYIKWHPGRLELAEGLEQLRWLEHGWRIRCVEGNPPAVQPEVNYPEDVDRVHQFLVGQLLAAASDGQLSGTGLLP